MILDEIVAKKRKELAAAKIEYPLEKITERAGTQPQPNDFAARLKGDRLQIIAEVKRASPSKGIIAADFDPVNIARAYAENGAAAISVLTEANYFQGKLDYLAEIRNALGNARPPLLRKDFLFDPYQIFEARAYGADAVLLITAILTKPQLRELLTITRELHMKALVEVHNEEEVNTAIECGAEIIGINNRDLKTFIVDLSTTEKLTGRIPGGKIVVSESGIKERNDISRLQQCGVHAVLVGESLMTSADIGAKIRELQQ